MKRIVFILLFILLPSGLCYAGSSINGTWKVKQRLCSYHNDELYECEKGNSNYTVSNNKLYYSGYKIGTAKKSGKKITFAYSSDYLKTTLEKAFQNSGATVIVEEASLSFSGTLRKNTIKNGKIKGTIVMVFVDTGGGGGKKSKISPSEAEPSITPEPGVTYTIEYSGKFTAKKQKRKSRSLKELHNREGHYGDIIEAFDYSKLHQYSFPYVTLEVNPNQ